MALVVTKLGNMFCIFVHVLFAIVGNQHAGVL